MVAIIARSRLRTLVVNAFVKIGAANASGAPDAALRHHHLQLPCCITDDVFPQRNLLCQPAAQQTVFKEGRKVGHWLPRQHMAARGGGEQCKPAKVGALGTGVGRWQGRTLSGSR